MKHSSSIRRQLVIGGMLLLVTLIWCGVAGRVIYYTGDSMVGLHPPLLLLLPYAVGLGLLAAICCVTRRWVLAGMAVVGVFAVMIVFSQGSRIGLWAWSQSIRQHDAVNQNAIRTSAAIPELTDETVTESIGDDAALPVLDGFAWYCEHPQASSQGAFRAFRYRGIVHVRIQKIRHGYRGIAFVSSPEDKEKLAKDSQLIYENGPPVEGHWVIWRID